MEFLDARRKEKETRQLVIREEDSVRYRRISRFGRFTRFGLVVSVHSHELVQSFRSIHTNRPHSRRGAATFAGG